MLRGPQQPRGFYAVRASLRLAEGALERQAGIEPA